MNKNGTTTVEKESETNTEALILVKGDIGIKKAERIKELKQLAKDYENIVVTKVTFEECKKARLRLREERYTIQRQSKTTKDTLNTLKSMNSALEEELISIIRPIEDKIDEGIKAIEQEKQREREENERLQRQEQERIEALEQKVAKFREQGLQNIIDCSSLKDLDALKEKIENYSVTEENFQEKHADAYMIKQSLLSKIEERRGQVMELEELRAKSKESEEKEILRELQYQTMKDISGCDNAKDFESIIVHYKGRNPNSESESFIEQFNSIIADFLENANQKLTLLKDQEKKQAEYDKFIQEKKKTEEKELLEKKMKDWIKKLKGLGFKEDESGYSLVSGKFNYHFTMKSIEEFDDNMFEERVNFAVSEFDKYNQDLQRWIYRVTDINKVPEKYLIKSVDASLVEAAIEEGIRKISGIKICQVKDLKD